MEQEQKTEYDKVNLSVYKSAVLPTTAAKQGAVVTLDAVVNRIRSGDKGLAENTVLLRNILASGKKEKYRKLKAQILPAASFSGVFSTRDSEIKDISDKWIEHTSLVTMDIDGINPSDIPAVFAVISSHPSVLLAFISPSGIGIKAICAISPVPTTKNDSEHKYAWTVCKTIFDEMLSPFGLHCDIGGSDPTRLCFFVYDPDVVYNPSPIPTEWDKDAYLKAQDQNPQSLQRDNPVIRAELENMTWGQDDIDKKALDFIHPDSLSDYNDWLRVLMAGKSAGLSMSEMDMWSRRGSKYQEGEVESRWDGFRTGEVNWGTIVYFAQLNGYSIPNKTRYQVDTSHKHKTSDMQSERDANAKALREWIKETEVETNTKHLLVLGSAAGTGKTTVSVMSIDNLLYIAKTTEEADSVYDDLVSKEEDVYRHRPRLYNRDKVNWESLPLGLTEDTRPCIQPELCNLHAERLGTTQHPCNACPLQADCHENGFLSQTEKELNASKVIYAETEALVCDEVYKNQVNRICSKDDTVIVDEVNALVLVQNRMLTRDMVYDLNERFKRTGPDGDDKYREVQRIVDNLLAIFACSDEGSFITRLRAWYDDIDDPEEMNDIFGKYPLHAIFYSPDPTEGIDTHFAIAVHNWERKEAILPVVEKRENDTTVADIEDDAHVFYVSELRQIKPLTHEVIYATYSQLKNWKLATLDDPPRRYQNLISDLETFFNENPQLDTAPYTYCPKQQRLDYKLKPTLNHHRVIFNTASDVDNLIGEVYKGTDVNVTIHTGTPPAWKKGTLCFQLTTGNYLPRQSLIQKVGDELRLKDRAQQMIDRLVVPTIKAGAKVLLVAPKSFGEIDTIKVLDCDVINHHHAEGRNDYQDHDVVFIFHYEPNHNPIPTQAKHIYRQQDIPLSFERGRGQVQVAGVSFEKNVYTDKRVQAIYNRECRARLMQSAMRLRPNIHRGKVVVFFTAEPVDIPITPIPFRPTDTKLFDGNWKTFESILETIKQNESAGDVKTVMETQGVSERTARQKTAEARKQIKADRDTEICTRFANGESKKNIAKEMGIGQGTVKRVLDAQTF